MARGTWILYDIAGSTAVAACGCHLEETIASGKYYVKDGTAYLEGTYNTYVRYEWSRYGIDKHYPIYSKGIFRISNAEEGNGLEVKSKGELRLTPVEVKEYFLRGENMVIHKKQGNTIIYPFLRRYSNIKSIELHERDSTPETSIVNFENGDRFEGVIDYEIKDSVEFVVGDEGLIKSGTYYYANGDKFEGTLSGGEPWGTYYYANGDKFEGTLSGGEPWSGTYYYANGDKYVKDGSVITGCYHYPNGDKMVINEDGKSGAYYYANGDKFIGDLTTKFISSVRKEKPMPIFVEGKIIFADGEEVEGNWLYKYESEIGSRGAAADSLKYHLNHSKTLIELRDGVRRAYALKKREEAKEKTELKKRLVAKYGSRYGTLLANEEIAVGMTQEMVREVVPRGLYKISRTVRNGRTITLWYYDDRGNSNSDSFWLFLSGFHVDKRKTPSSMTFVNDRLTNIEYDY